MGPDIGEIKPPVFVRPSAGGGICSEGLPRQSAGVGMLGWGGRVGLTVIQIKQKYAETVAAARPMNNNATQAPRPPPCQEWSCADNVDSDNIIHINKGQKKKKKGSGVLVARERRRRTVCGRIRTRVLHCRGAAPRRTLSFCDAPAALLMHIQNSAAQQSRRSTTITDSLYFPFGCLFTLSTLLFDICICKMMTCKTM